MRAGQRAKGLDNSQGGAGGAREWRACWLPHVWNPTMLALLPHLSKRSCLYILVLLHPVAVASCCCYQQRPAAVISQRFCSALLLPVRVCAGTVASAFLSAEKLRSFRIQIKMAQWAVSTVLHTHCTFVLYLVLYR